MWWFAATLRTGGDEGPTTFISCTAPCSKVLTYKQNSLPRSWHTWVLKVYRDVVVDGRGTKPVSPNDVLRPRDARDFREEDIGYLTRPVRLNEWIATVRSRYAFIPELDANERRWVDCNERDRYEVHTALASFDLARDQTVERTV